MPKGQQKQGHQNKPKLTVKEKAEKKAAKKASHDLGSLPPAAKK